MKPSSNDMTCKELVELVTDYLEGALSPEDQRRFELHIAKCDWCKIYIGQMRLTVQTLGKIAEESFSPQALDEFLQVFRDWKRS